MHVCNDIGGWGAGFVLALSRKWPTAEQRYRAWHQERERVREIGEESRQDEVPFELGQVQFVQVAANLWIANLIGQHGIQRQGSLPPVRYDAIRQGLQRVAEFAQEIGAPVHMPRIGCGLAGGKWDEVSQIVTEELIEKGISVTVYDLPPRT